METMAGSATISLMHNDRELQSVELSVSRQKGNWSSIDALEVKAGDYIRVVAKPMEIHPNHPYISHR